MPNFPFLPSTPEYAPLLTHFAEAESAPSPSKPEGFATSPKGRGKFR